MITNGIRATHRNRWLFLKEKILTINEMMVLDFYIDKINHSATSEFVGTFELNLDEIDEYFHKKKSTVAVWNQRLIDLGFIKKVGSNRFEVTNWRRYFLEEKNNTGGLAFKFQKEEYGKSVESLIQELGINFQITGKNGKDLTESSTLTAPLVLNRLSKDNINTNTQNKIVEEKKTIEKVVDVGVSDSNNIDKRVKNVAGQFPKWVLIQQEPRTDKEYQSIQNEQADDMKMPIEDMKWIDQNACGYVKVEDEDKEKWTVEIYFDGDQAKYENYLEPSRTRAIINYYPKIG